MQHKQLLAALAAAGVCALLAGVALQERGGRSPAALLATQKLYGYYPYPYGGAYGGGAYGGYPYGAQYGGGYPGYAGGYYGGGYPYYGGAGGYPYGGGYPGYAYDEDNAYQQYASQEQYRQWSDYAAQQQYEDAAAQANYYNWAAANAYKGKHADVLKVANGASKAQSLVYMGDLEFGGYKHEITGGNDGGYNAPFDINGDGQEIDNWAKVTTQWKHKKGGKQLKNTKGATQLKQNKIQQLRLNTAQANAQVAGIFDDMAHSEHGANNGMLQKRAQHKPKVAPVDPKMQPVQSIFSVEGNGDVSVKGRSQQLAGMRSRARMQSLDVTEENPLGATLDAIPDTVNSLNGFNEEDTSPEEIVLRNWDWYHAAPTEVGSGVPAVP